MIETIKEWFRPRNTVLTQTIVRMGRKPKMHRQEFNLSRKQLIKHLSQTSEWPAQTFIDLARVGQCRLKGKDGHIDIKIVETK